MFGTIVSGGALTGITKFVNRNSDKRDDRRIDLDEIRQLRERIDTVEAEVTEWRNRFYAEQDFSTRLQRFIINQNLEPPARRNE